MFIRTMNTDDLEYVVSLEKQLFTSSWTKEDFLYELNDNDFSFNYVVEKDGMIAGYVGLWLMYEQSQITTIGVDPRFQRNGIGQYMLETMIELARQHDCQVMSLEVRVSNEKAINLYKKLGFHIECIRKNYYQDNHEDAYLMIKELEEER